MVQVFTGNGRGKTSAALGTVMRAAGYGLKVYMIFFMKGIHDLGEYESLKRLGVEFEIFGRPGLFGPKDICEEDHLKALHLLQHLQQKIYTEEYDLVVLDEANTAAAWELIPQSEIMKLIKHKPKKLELILTGRYASKEILDAADLVTELDNIKHPYDKGIPARKGLDY